MRKSLIDIQKDLQGDWAFSKLANLEPSLILFLRGVLSFYLTCRVLAWCTCVRIPEIEASHYPVPRCL